MAVSKTSAIVKVTVREDWRGELRVVLKQKLDVRILDEP